jgi:hypothetical protein
MANATDVAVGYYFSCAAVSAAGGVQCWCAAARFVWEGAWICGLAARARAIAPSSL